MDLQEWELLPDDGFLEIHDDGGKKIFSRKYGGDPRKDVFNTNYFICPSPISPKLAGQRANQRLPNQLVPVPIQLPETAAASGKELEHDEPVKEEVIINDEVPIDHHKAKAPNMVAVDRDSASQVFFKKMKENEFVDMKMDSPRSGGGRGILPQIDAAAGKFQFEDRSEAYKAERQSEKETKKTNLESDSEREEEESSWEDKNGGLNLWKWSLTGIGAICSFGVAAATICIIICGTHQKNEQQQNQKLRFQMYADDKRMKQVVEHASKWDEAISATRGMPLTRAQITIGGHFDGL